MTDEAAERLVVLCHGVGGDGSQLQHLAAAWGILRPGTVFLAPEAPFPHRGRHARFKPWGRPGGGREWFSLIDRSAAAQERGVRTASAVLGDIVDAELRRLALPPTAYALVGFSQGAMVALFAGLRRRHAPRAILCFAGALIAPDALPGELGNTAPVLLVHGDADAVVPSACSRAAERELRNLGVPVEALYISGCGHAIPSSAIVVGGAFLMRAFAGHGP